MSFTGAVVLECQVCICCTGQIGLGVGSWPNNRTNTGSPPSEIDYNSVILLKNVYVETCR